MIILLMNVGFSFKFNISMQASVNWFPHRCTQCRDCERFKLHISSIMYFSGRFTELRFICINFWFSFINVQNLLKCFSNVSIWAKLPPIYIQLRLRFWTVLFNSRAWNRIPKSAYVILFHEMSISIKFEFLIKSNTIFNCLSESYIY